MGNLIEAGFLDGLSTSTGSSAGAVRRELLDAAVSLPVGRAKRSQPELPHPASFWESRRPEGRAVQSMPFPPSEALRRQRKVLGVDVAGHPLASYRGVLRDLGVKPASELRKLEGGTRARAAGIMESLQRPPAKPGNRPVNFLLVEDETGLLQCILFAEAFSRCGHLIYRAGAFLLEGTIEQDRRRGFSFVVDRIADLGEVLSRQSTRTNDPQKAGERDLAKDHGSRARTSGASTRRRAG